MRSASSQSMSGSAELGPDSPDFHRELGALAARSRVDIVIAVGEPARAYLDGAGRDVSGHWVADAAAAAANGICTPPAGGFTAAGNVLAGGRADMAASSSVSIERGERDIGFPQG